MYRLLIVDDEEIITDGLYEVFRNYMPEQLDVYKAYSGTEALQWMKRTRIDIILSDIAMPGMNGIELIEQVHSYWPKCKVVFLTGHSNFDYTYQAMQMDGVKYILKTEGYDKVIEVMDEMILKIQHQTEQIKLVEKSREQINAYQFMEQSEYLRHMLQKRLDNPFNLQEILEEFKSFNIKLNPSKKIFLVHGRITYPKGSTYTMKNEIQTFVRKKWNDYMSGILLSMEIVDRYSDLIWFIQDTEMRGNPSSEHVPTYIEGTLELLQQECIDSLDVVLSFIISSNFCSWLDVPEQYEQLRQIQQMKINNNVPTILRDNQETKRSSINYDYSSINYKLEIMLAHAEANRKQAFLQELNLLIDTERTNGNIYEMKETYYRIGLLLYSYINQRGWQHVITQHELLLDLDEHISIEEGFDFLREVAKQLFDYNQKDDRDRATHVIETICQYIQQHLSEDLSLVKLAEIHYFNPSYLSHFFKQEKGINLSEYIERCRIKKAKELLERRDLRIKDVCVAVGYVSAHSFTRFFKKVTGKTPKEYRDSLYIH
ncbi:response regulator [Gracilibacillus marinus]|uniref:Response regulator n=1 Tax=Gracilibacillus marinus TaxID=630535 RepID=A0ABV8W119_9BACI